MYNIYDDELKEINKKIDDWKNSVLPRQVTFLEEKKNFSNTRWKIDSNSEKMEKEVKFFEENDECPTCEQTINVEAKVKAVTKRADKMMTNACALIRMDEQLNEMDSREQLYDKMAEDARAWEVDAAKKKTSANALEAFNKQLLEHKMQLRPKL